MENFIKKFSEIGLSDIACVGYKNASIGKMTHHLMPNGVPIPGGFAITANAYRHFIGYNNLDLPLKHLLLDLDKKAFTNLAETGTKARKMIMNGKMPGELGMAIMDAYDYLFDKTSTEVAVRSSAVANHMADAVASGLNDSFLNVSGHCALLYAVRQCFASLYTDRAIKFAAEKGYSLSMPAMAVGIQDMVRADTGCSGVGYTRSQANGSADVIYIKGIWGLGDLINHELVEPDEYLVFTPSLNTDDIWHVEKEIGSKHKMMVYAGPDDETYQTLLIDTPVALQKTFVLNEKDIKQLANWATLLENIYHTPMCFEWAKDGHNHQLYLIQVSPYANKAIFNSPKLATQ